MEFDSVSFGPLSDPQSLDGVVRYSGDDSGVESAARKCETACRIVNELYQKNPIDDDMVPSYLALKAWPFIVSAYSGVEQATKILLRMSDIGYPNTGKAGHRLDLLFNKLPPSERGAVQTSYTVYQSLHAYINTVTSDAFLKSISVGFGSTGYDDWRYLLMDYESDYAQTKVPLNHVGAMLEIWAALGSVLLAKVGLSSWLHTVADRVDTKIRACLDDVGRNQPHRLTQDDVADLQNWIDGGEGYISAYAKFYRLNAQNRTAAMSLTPRTLQFLRDSVPYAESRRHRDQDFHLFLSLAQRGPIRRDAVENRFEF